MGVYDTPRRGQTVHDAHRLPDSDPNGIIISVDYEDHTVVVKFYLSKEREEYNWDELQGNWTDKFGGIYFIRGIT